VPAAPSFWKRRGPTAAFFLPLSYLFGFLAGLRRTLYDLGVLKTYRVGVPVVVVGNIAVGGSGKTPVVLWLADRLVRAGRRPGIVSRGYGGSAQGCQAVLAESDPATSGDEPVLLARRSRCPVWIGRDRVAAAQALRRAHPEVDVILTDDGLQHYRLARDIEIAVVDDRQLGNGLLLPAGPLREPLSRLAGCDMVLAHGELSPEVRAICPPAPIYRMQLMPTAFYRLGQPLRRRSAGEFEGMRVRAIAGIGRPERFFDTLSELGLEGFERRALPDHHVFKPEDVRLDGVDAIVVTEKDAVKLRAFAPEETWVLPVDAEIREEAFEYLLERLNGCKAA
jgi:tetraacyldisaccharide 4'-kinase